MKTQIELDDGIDCGGAIWKMQPDSNSGQDSSRAHSMPVTMTTRRTLFTARESSESITLVPSICRALSLMRLIVQRRQFAFQLVPSKTHTHTYSLTDCTVLPPPRFIAVHRPRTWGSYRHDANTGGKGNTTVCLVSTNRHSHTHTHGDLQHPMPPR